MHDASTKSWGLWGDYLESLFTQQKPAKDNNKGGGGVDMTLGISAITAFMNACRHNQETKARKYIAKIIWLLMYDDEKGVLADAVDKYCMGVPPIQWLPWVPQLLNSLVRQDGKMVINLLNQVGRMYPQAVYFPIRTLYLTLKVEQKDKVRNAEYLARISAMNQGGADQGGGAGDTQQQQSSSAPSPASNNSEAQAIRATPSMWRCSKLMHMQRDLHPTILASLEGIVDQVWNTLFFKHF
jgi:transformation/transcription domain-associated protein